MFLYTRCLAEITFIFVFFAFICKLALLRDSIAGVPGASEEAEEFHQQKIVELEKRCLEQQERILALEKELEYEVNLREIAFHKRYHWLVLQQGINYYFGRFFDFVECLLFYKVLEKKLNII